MLLASKPRSAIDDAPGVGPAPLLEEGTPFGPATVKFRTNSAVVRSPALSIRSRVRMSTGFGPTSWAVGILEPVTTTRSASAGAAVGVGDAAVIEAGAIA